MFDRIIVQLSEIIFLNSEKETIFNSMFLNKSEFKPAEFKEDFDKKNKQTVKKPKQKNQNQDCNIQ